MALTNYKNKAINNLIMLEISMIANNMKDIFILENDSINEDIGL